MQILAKRAGGSSGQFTIATPHEKIEGRFALNEGSEYRLFSPDLTLAAVEPRGATPLAEGVTERTQYVRDNTTCETAPATCYTPLVTPADTKPGAKWGGSTEKVKAEEEFISASTDLSHAVIHSNVQLTGSRARQWSVRVVERAADAGQRAARE